MQGARISRPFLFADALQMRKVNALKLCTLHPYDDALPNSFNSTKLNP